MVLPSEPNVECLEPAKTSNIRNRGGQRLKHTSHTLQFLPRKYAGVGECSTSRSLRRGACRECGVVVGDEMLQARGVERTHVGSNRGTRNNVAGRAVTVTIGHQY